MKDLKNTLNEAIIARIKSPILGTYLLCYLSINYKGIFSFYIGSIEERKIILDSFKFLDFNSINTFFSSDFFIAVVLTLTYILIAQFILPFCQIGINYMVNRYITKLGYIQQATFKTSYFNAIAESKEAEYRADYDYIKAKYDKGFESWEINKVNMEHQLKEQNSSISTLTKTLSSTIEGQKKDQSVIGNYVYIADICDKMSSLVEPAKLNVFLHDLSEAEMLALLNTNMPLLSNAWEQEHKHNFITDNEGRVMSVKVI